MHCAAFQPYEPRAVGNTRQAKQMGGSTVEREGWAAVCGERATCHICGFDRPSPDV